MFSERATPHIKRTFFNNLLNGHSQFFARPLITLCENFLSAANPPSLFILDQRFTYLTPAEKTLLQEWLIKIIKDYPQSSTPPIRVVWLACLAAILQIIKLSPNLMKEYTIILTKEVDNNCDTSYGLLSALLISQRQSNPTERLQSFIRLKKPPVAGPYQNYLEASILNPPNGLQLCKLAADQGNIIAGRIYGYWEITYGTDEIAQQDGRSLLIQAAKGGDAKAILLLLDYCDDINIKIKIAETLITARYQKAVGSIYKNALMILIESYDAKRELAKSAFYARKLYAISKLNSVGYFQTTLEHSLTGSDLPTEFLIHAFFILDPSNQQYQKVLDAFNYMSLYQLSDVCQFLNRETDENIQRFFRALNTTAKELLAYHLSSTFSALKKNSFPLDMRLYILKYNLGEKVPHLYSKGNILVSETVAARKKACKLMLFERYELKKQQQQEAGQQLKKIL